MAILRIIIKPIIHEPMVNSHDHIPFLCDVMLSDGFVVAAASTSLTYLMYRADT